MNKNLLDLRDKGKEKIKVVERIIFKPRSFKSEMIRLSSVIVIVLAIGFGISNADDIPVLKNINSALNGTNSQLKTSSIFGQIQEIGENSVSIQKIVDNSLQEDIYAVDVTDATFQKSDYEYLSFSDLKIGDKIIVKGFLKQETYLEAKKIFVFPLSPEERLAFEALLATTTIDIATSTVDIASSTTDTASSIDDMATTTATTTINISTTTEEFSSSTIDTSTTTEENASSTPSIIDTATYIIENIVETVVDTVNEVIDTVTGNTEPITEEPEVVEESAPVEPETTVTEPEPTPEPAPVSEPVTE